MGPINRLLIYALPWHKVALVTVFPKLCLSIDVTWGAYKSSDS